jgi:putative ABC transport system substrate-binding protein
LHAALALEQQMKRRTFTAFIAGATAAACPVAARAQQSAAPVIAFLDSQLAGGFLELLLPAFRQGLKEAGYTEGDNVTFEYRWAKNELDQLASLATELARRRASVIVATGPSAALAAKAATTTIPILFGVGDDPVKMGLVASLARPGGNLTGVNFLASELAAKRLEFLRQMVPAAKHVALLIDPGFAPSESQVSDALRAGKTMDLNVQLFRAATSQDINGAFSALASQQPDAVYVGASPFFASRRVQLVLLAARIGIPAVYGTRLFTEIGGLMNYGASLTDAYRQIGHYAGRLLKGTKPAELPVLQAAKFELVINAETARMLGLVVPPSLLAIADEVIE